MPNYERVVKIETTESGYLVEVLVPFPWTKDAPRTVDILDEAAKVIRREVGRLR